MRLIFIRHGDPDYANDNLTEKGKREVELLTERVCKWFSTEESLKNADFYSSPLGRARATGAPALKKLNREAEVCEWLQEFPTWHENSKGEGLRTWDIMPDTYCEHKEFFDKDNWCHNDYMGTMVPERYEQVCNGIDSILKKYGYIRNEKNFYTVQNPIPNRNWNNPIEQYHLTAVKEDYPEEKTLVFFCHLGVMFTIISHLTSVSPMQLWQGFYVAPTSVTVLNSEERMEGMAWFRVERMGDTNHLTNGGEPISSSGYFAEVLREKLS